MVAVNLPSQIFTVGREMTRQHKGGRLPLFYITNTTWISLPVPTRRDGRLANHLYVYYYDKEGFSCLRPHILLDTHTHTHATFSFLLP